MSNSLKGTHFEKDNRFFEHRALYVGWEEMEQVVRELLDDDTIELSNDDPWSYKAFSEKTGETYSDYDLLPRLAEYLGLRLSTSHVDEHGVWLVVEEG